MYPEKMGEYLNIEGAVNLNGDDKMAIADTAINSFYRMYFGIGQIQAFDHLISQTIGTTINTVLNATIAPGWRMLIKGVGGGLTLFINGSIKRAGAPLEALSQLMGKSASVKDAERVLTISSLTGFNLLTSLIEDIGDWISRSKGLSFDEFPPVQAIRSFVEKVQVSPQMAFQEIMIPQVGLGFATPIGVQNFLPGLDFSALDTVKEKIERESLPVNTRELKISNATF